MSSSCDFTGTVDGADNGGIIIASGQTLTIGSGQTVVWGPGKSIVINGSIALNSTAVLKQTRLWIHDADSDGYPSSTTQFAQSGTPGAGYLNRSSVANYASADCSDASANVFQDVGSIATDADQDGYYTGSTATTCVGDTTVVSSRTYYKNTSGNYFFITSGAAIGGSDVNDSSSTVWQSLNCYTDVDEDGYTIGSAVATDSGADCPSGKTQSSSGTDCLDSNSAKWQNRYFDGDGDGHAPNSTLVCVGNDANYYDSRTGFNDCNDSCATCFPGSTSWTSSTDGLDQDCINGTDNNTAATSPSPHCSLGVDSTALNQVCNAYCSPGTVSSKDCLVGVNNSSNHWWQASWSGGSCTSGLSHNDWYHAHGNGCNAGADPTGGFTCSCNPIYR